WRKGIGKSGKKSGDQNIDEVRKSIIDTIQERRWSALNRRHAEGQKQTEIANFVERHFSVYGEKR
ncbi:MAG: hypothetical protein ACO3LT_05900, partial [Ilumatobacteraceae bacterium]